MFADAYRCVSLPKHCTWARINISIATTIINIIIIIIRICTITNGQGKQTKVIIVTIIFSSVSSRIRPDTHDTQTDTHAR